MKHYSNALKIILLYILLSFYAQANTIEQQIINNAIDKSYANRFSTLIVQSKDGRMKPLDSLHLDILNKLIGQTSYKGLGYNQVILSMAYQPHLWQHMPLFELPHEQIKKNLHTQSSHISFAGLFKNNQYKLEEEVLKAQKVDEKNRNSYQKAIIKLHDKVETCNLVFSLQYMKIYPLPNTINNQWYAPLQLRDITSNEGKVEAQQLYANNKHLVNEALDKNDWSEASKSIQQIQLFQTKYGQEVLPSAMQQQLEVLYNKVLLFERLYGFYLLLGILLFVLNFTVLLQGKGFKRVIAVCNVMVIIAFVLHGINLVIRWYISEHAPWSNAYESMVFIAWTILLAGIVFHKKSDFGLALCSFCAGVLLFSAHLNFIDPEITNLTPSLQSIWLTIHVAIISASYGFLALCALLGILMLLLFCFKTKSNETSMQQSLLQTSKVNELSMMIGFSLLIVGTLLGSVWANESWGRIWGWDPKESWSLISILLYMVILHLRLSKKLQSLFVFATISLWVYLTILMTYFGVNYFFDAIHVYASNNNSEIPIGAYVVTAVLFILNLVAYKKRVQS